MKIRTALKALSLVFTLLLIVIVAPLGYLLLSDANDFKPQLQQLALEQGVQLDVVGDLNWQIYPDIELEINDVILKSEQEGVALDASLGMTKLQVELRPLFSGELKIRGIEISDSSLALNELMGADNKEEAEKVESQETIQETTSDENTYSPAISAQLISVKNLDLKYSPIDGEPVALHINELGFEQLNLEGEPFVANLGFSYQGQAQEELKISTEASLTINLKKKSYSLSSDQLKLKLAGETPLEIDAEVSASANIASNQWNLALTQAQIEDLIVKTNASGSIEPLSALGQLELNGGSQLVNSLLVDSQSGQNILESLSVRAGFDYSPERLFLKDAVAKFNDSNLTASAQYYLKGDKPNEIRLSLDKIDLDHYTNADSEEQNKKSGSGENPLKVLENIPATNVYLDIGELSTNGQKLTDINIEVAVANSEANIKLANTTLAEGVVKGTLIARANEIPQLVISDFTANQINLAPLIVNESGQPLLQGIANLDFKGQIHILSADSVAKELDGTGRFDVSDLVLADTNIEQSICVSAKQLGATAALTEQWTSGTQFDQFSSPYKINKGLLSLENIGTGFGNIKLVGGGEVDLDSMDFSAKLSMRINGDRTSEQGCSINKYLRNTKLPLSCDGNLSEGGDTSCGLDSSVVGELLKGQIKNELGRQLGRLLGDSKDESLESNDANGSNKEEQRSSEDQVKDAVKGLLEGLFKQ